MINSGHRCPLLMLPVKVTGALPRRYQQNTQGAARLLLGNFKTAPA